MKPILFSTPMVQAIMDGRKTQTRRVLKPANPFKSKAMGGYSQGNGLWVDGYGDGDGPNGHIKDYSVSACWYRKDTYIDCYAPFHPGDILWVRETWCSAYDGEAFFYRADKLTPREQKKLLDYDEVRWRPSIFMPKEAARLFLRVANVRVERVGDISEKDAVSEGVTPEPMVGCNERKCLECDSYNQHGAHKDYKLSEEQCYIDAKTMFSDLWDSINAKRGFNWESNPWVWVYTFEHIPKEEAQEN